MDRKEENVLQLTLFFKFWTTISSQEIRPKTIFRERKGSKKYNNNNNHIFGRNGTYVQNIYITFIFTALSYQASAEQFNSKSYSDKIQTFDKLYTLEYLFQVK